MEKTNIIFFNNNTYSIDDSFLSAEKSKLEQHLSTTMNGTGAVISLGGTAYNIDSTKLSTARNAFISHLGTIAGNGKKIVIGGVEYSVGSDKVAVAIGELEAVLGGLNSDDSNEDTLPKKNEYGFYYNVPYVTKTDGIITFMMMLSDDGRCFTFAYDERVSEVLAGTDLPYTYDEATNSINVPAFGATLTISDDGNALTMFDTTTIADVTMAVSGGIYYEDVYISQDGNKTIIFHEDGSITLQHNGVSETIVENQWANEYYGYISGRYNFCATIDGELICLTNYYEDGQYILYSRVKSK